MKKGSRIRGVDYIALVLLIGYAFILLVALSFQKMQKEHIAGLVFVALVIAAFLFNKKIGVIFLGLTLLPGVIGFIALNGNLANNFVRIGDVRIKFQADFLALAIIHFICSGRHYIGIATAAYWENIFDKGRFVTKKTEE